MEYKWPLRNRKTCCFLIYKLIYKGSFLYINSAVWCIIEEKILVLVPVQGILLIPLRVNLGALECRQFGGI